MTVFLLADTGPSSAAFASAGIERAKVWAGEATGPGARVWSSGGCHAVFFDIGAFESTPAAFTESQAFMLAGDPVLPIGGGRDFPGSVERLRMGLAKGEASVLAECRGTFCCVHFDARTGDILAATDKLGVRSLYTYADVDLRVVSSSLRLLHRFLGEKARFDQAESLKLASLGFLVGNRTTLDGVQAARPATLVHWPRNHAPAPLRYWEWASVTRPKVDSYTIDEFDARFMEALRLRIVSGAGLETSFLSGGLDSRAIVAGLRGLDRPVRSVGYGLPGTADLEVASRIAEAFGVVHLPVRTQGSVQEKSIVCIDALRKELGSDVPIRRMWSGDGGSVVVGHVYMDLEKGDDLQTDHDRSTSQALHRARKANGWSIPAGLLQRDFVASVRSELEQDWEAASAGLEVGDCLRCVHRIIVGADQRWHLLHHHETILEQKVELLLPFFDSSVVDWIFQHPADGFLKHSFYNEWVRRTRRGVTAEPWQHYPGHHPSPLPLDASLSTQWERKPVSTRTDILRKGAAVLSAAVTRRSSRISIGHAVFAILAAALGSTQYDYAIEQARKYLDPLADFHA